MCLQRRRAETLLGRGRGWALSLLLITSPGAISAHPESEVAIVELSQWIARHPAQASLYLARSRHFFDHERWEECERDLKTAEKLDPQLEGLGLAYCRLYLATGAMAAAAQHVDAVLQHTPDEPTALILRARVRASSANPVGAVADLSRAIEVIPEPRPELYLERAALQTDPKEALRGIISGIERIGPAVPLMERALTLETQLGQVDDALRRLETMTSSSSRKEFGWKRRGDLLNAAGRTDDARNAYHQARAALASQPAWLQGTPESQALSLALAALP